MSLIHAAAYGLEVVFHESVAYFKHALFLFDDEFCAEVVFSGDIALYGVEHGVVGVAKSLDTEALCHALAGSTAFVVGRVGELVFYYRVNEHESVIVGFEGEVFIFH